MDSERLLLERAKQRLSRQELAERSGVNAHTISEMERGVRSPRATTVAKVAEALGLEPEELLGKAPSPSPQTPESRAGEGLRSSEDAWRAEYLKLADEMLGKWEDELEEKIALADSDPKRFLEWTDEIAKFGRPLITGIVSGYMATTSHELAAVAGAAPFMGPWGDLWRRIEKVTMLDEEDQRRLLEQREKARQPDEEAQRQGL